MAAKKSGKATKKSTARSKAASTATKKSGQKRSRKPSPAFMRPLQPDDVLAKVVGSKPLPRTEVTKKVWDYIKKNKLQDEKNRRAINADDALRPVFQGKNQVSMFEMTKLVNEHLK
jgi:chromatin remodeling complex protein RSC6